MIFKVIICYLKETYPTVVHLREGVLGFDFVPLKIGLPLSIAVIWTEGRKTMGAESEVASWSKQNLSPASLMRRK